MTLIELLAFNSISILKLTAATLLVPFMLELILTNGEAGFTFLVSILLNQSEALIHEPMRIEKPSLTISNINNDSRLARPKYKKDEHYPENFERHH